jgi:hypothetical protein
MWARTGVPGIVKWNSRACTPGRKFSVHAPGTHDALAVRMSLRTRVLSVSLVGLAACSGSTAATFDDAGAGEASVDGAPAVTIEKAAGDAANAYCARAQACAPAYVSIGYGDVATCVSTFTADLVRGFGGAGVTATPDWVEGCAAAVPQVSCGDFLARRTVAACKPVPGSLADGAACAADGQCKGTRCILAKNQVCGVCGPHAAAGAACGVDDDCDNGLVCLTGICVAYRDEKATCDATHPCRPDLACTAGICGAGNPVGTACSSGDGCNAANGIVCNPISKQCETMGFASPNTGCGIVGPKVVECTGPALCIGVVAPKYQGSCVAAAALGASCDTANGPPCGADAVCACAAGTDAGGCAGTCKQRDPAQCH